MDNDDITHTHLGRITHNNSYPYFYQRESASRGRVC